MNMKLCEMNDEMVNTFVEMQLMIYV